MVATANRREGACNRTGAPSVTFCVKRRSKGAGRRLIFEVADKKNNPEQSGLCSDVAPPTGLEPVTHTACGTQKLFPSYFTRPTFDRCAKKKALPLPPAARLPFSDNSSTFKCAVQTNYHSFFSVEDRKRRYPSVSPFSMAPPTGLEPVTLRLTAECSTD